MPQPPMTVEKAAPQPPRLAEELKKMEQEYEPLLAVEKKLIGYTLAGGVVLLVVLVVISRVFL